MNTPPKKFENRADKWDYHSRRDDSELPELQEFTMMSLNIGSFNGEEKQHVIGQLIHQEQFHVVCLNETKLTIPVGLGPLKSAQHLLHFLLE